MKEYKAGDKIKFRNYDIRREDDKLIVADIRQIPTYYKGEYIISPNDTYDIKEGIVRFVYTNGVNNRTWNWDGDVYVIHCEDDVWVDEEGHPLAFDHNIPSEWIVEDK